MPFALPYPDIDPVIFTIELGSFAFSLRWYALAYLAGLLGALYMAKWLVRRPNLWRGDVAPMDEEAPERLLTWAVLGVILGGRLGFVVFYQPAYYLANPGEILQVWNGGMSFHGGFIGVMVAFVGFARLNNIALLNVADIGAVTAPLGLLLGRLANFINGELWGRPTDAPWAFVFPGAGPLPRHPSQLYEAALEGLLLLVLMWVLVLKAHWLKRPGMLAGLFFIGYGAARAFVENFREADTQFITPDNPAGHVVRLGTDIGLTMGQSLSLPMVLIGLAFWAYAMRQPKTT
ncbi:MAG: prolipoprotein diacylglyceryl transferase [Pikeienuella sp.]